MTALLFPKEHLLPGKDALGFKRLFAPLNEIIYGQCRPLSRERIFARRSLFDFAIRGFNDGFITLPNDRQTFRKNTPLLILVSLPEYRPILAFYPARRSFL